MPDEQGATPARKRGRPTEAERAQRRDDILDVAVELFVAQGFEVVTLDHIAASARVTKRTIYAYLGDRTEVFLAAVERLRERALGDTLPEGQLSVLSEKIVHVLHSDAAVGLHRLVVSESRRFPDLAERFYDEGPRRYIAAIESHLSGEDSGRGEALFGLLLGEPHRQRLLGLRPAPDLAASAALARAAMASLHLTDETKDDV